MFLLTDNYKNVIMTLRFDPEVFPLTTYATWSSDLTFNSNLSGITFADTIIQDLYNTADVKSLNLESQTLNNYQVNTSLIDSLLELETIKSSINYLETNSQIEVNVNLSNIQE